MTPQVLFLCTGNAARSVMAGAMLEASGLAVRVTTAGTHVVEHQPVSIRTRHALDVRGPACLGAPEPSAHRRRPGRRRRGRGDGGRARVLRPSPAPRRARTAPPRCASWRSISRWEPHRSPQRVAELGLASLDPAGQGDVADPAGGDDEDYVVCARELAELIGELVPRLG